MPTCTRRLEFDAGHRVLGHGGKCRFLHGHRYAVEITVHAPKLNDLGMAIDFGCIKEKVGKWIDDNLDHNFICHPDDFILESVVKYGWSITNGREPYVMPVGQNPTAENIAQLIFYQAQGLLNEDKVTVAHVRVYETPSCHADYYGQE